jgi:hypothetical protein
MSAVAVSCARYAPPVATRAWVKDLRTCQEQKNIHSATVTYKSFFSTGAQDSHLQRVTIPEAVYIQLRRRPPEDEQGNIRNM